MIRRLSIIYLLLELAAIGFVFLLNGCDEQQQHGGFTPPPMPVEVARVGVGSVVDRFTAVGSIEAGEAITVTSEIDGIVVDLLVRQT